MSCSKFEDEHVLQVYESIADHFSTTRYKRWPVVERFIAELPRGSLGCDLGCGNGKNLTWDSTHSLTVGLDTYDCAGVSLLFIGGDRCSGLLDICRSRGFEVVRGTVLCDPFRTGSFDFALSIAVLHHLRTRERRLEAVCEMLRVMRRGARGLVFVWAFEDNASVRRPGLVVLDGCEQDVLVPWSLPSSSQTDASHPAADTGHLRYYHLFKRGELEEFVQAAGGHLEQSGYDRDNWYVVFSKPDVE